METQNEKLTAEFVLQSVLELRKNVEKMAVENDRRAAENDRRAAENDRRAAENDKIIYEMRKNIRGISLSNGAFAEEALYNALNINKTFANIKYDFIRRNFPVVSKDYQTLTEIDLMMVNGNSVFIGKVKYTLTGSPFNFPGIHLGISFVNLTASSDNDLSGELITPAFFTEPSF